MAIQLHARKMGEERWGIMNAFIDDNMDREKLLAKANNMMHHWANSGAYHDHQFRVVDTTTLPKAQAREFERGRT